MLQEKREDSTKKKPYLDHKVVLVRPEHPENVGFTARAMKSCGIQRLALVESDQDVVAKARKTAVWSENILNTAQLYSSLDEAMGDHLVRVAFTARTKGKRARRIHYLEEWAEEVSNTGRSCSLIFGPESRGLESSEVELCDYIVRIPTHPDQPSLNLSHAVQLVVYSLFRRQHHQAEPRIERERAKQWAMRIVETAQAQGLFPRAGAPEAINVLTRLFIRAAPNEWEARWLEKQARDFWGTVQKNNPVRHR